MNYDQAATPRVTGAVWGILQIPPVSVKAIYAVGRDGAGVFSGTVEPAGGAVPDFCDLLQQGAFSPGPAGQPPADRGIPARIPMDHVMVTAVTGQYVEVEGWSAATSWGFTCAGQQIDVTSLGGRIRVAAPLAAGGGYTYECCLTGSVAFQGFVSVAAQCRFGSGQPLVLTATASAATSPVPIPALATGLASPPVPWSDVVPQGTPALTLGTPATPGTSAFLYLDLSADVFAIYGGLVPLRTGPGATAEIALVTRTVPDSPGPGSTRSYVVAARLGDGFLFADLWSALGDLVDGFLTVRAANLCVLSYEGTAGDLSQDIATITQIAARQGARFSVPFTDLPWLAGLPATNAVRKGAAVFADLQLGGTGAGTLSAGLGRVANAPAAAPALALWALVSRSDPTETVYHGQISALPLLGGALVLSGAVTYQPKTSQQLRIAGSIVLSLSTDSLTFDGEFILGSDHASFALDASRPGQSLASPFGGGMFGVTLRELRLAVSYDFPAAQPAASVISLTGTAALSLGQQQLDLSAGVLFSAGVPVVAFVELTSGFSLAQVLTDVGGPSWPSDFDPVALESGGLYYANLPDGHTVTVGDAEYQAGYHLSAMIAIFTVRFSIVVGVTHDRVQGSASYAGNGGIIDLVFAKLTGYTDPGTHAVLPGPTLSLTTGGGQPAAYGLGAGITLFGTPLATILFSYTPSMSKWSGSVTPTVAIPGVGTPTITFSYSEAEGLQITDFPLTAVIGEALQWARAIEQATTGDPCGTIARLALDQAISTSFDVSLSFDTSGTTSSGLPLLITGSYVITISGPSSARIPVRLPALHVSIAAPSAFEMSALPGWLATMLADNASSIARSLIDDHQPFIVFVGAFSAATWGPELIANFACRQVNPVNVAERANQLTTKQLNEIDDKASSTDASSGDAASAGSLSGLATSLTAAMTGLAALAALVTKLLGWIWTDSSERDRAERQRDDAQRKYDAAYARMMSVLTMSGPPAARFVSATSVDVTWTDADLPHAAGMDYQGYAGISFDVEAAANADFAGAARTTASGRAVTITAPAFASSTSAWVRMRAAYQGTPAAPGWEGPWISVAQPLSHQVPLPAPTSVTLSCDPDAGELTIGVAAVVSATHYQIDLLDHAHADAVILTAVRPAPASGPLTVTVYTRLLPGGVAAGATLTARAFALGDIVHSDSPVTFSDPAAALATLGPAGMPLLRLTASRLQVDWEPLAGATGGEVRVTDAAGVPLSPPPPVTIEAAGLGGRRRDGDPRLAQRSGLRSARCGETPSGCGPPSRRARSPGSRHRPRPRWYSWPTMRRSPSAGPRIHGQLAPISRSPTVKAGHSHPRRSAPRPPTAPRSAGPPSPRGRPTSSAAG